MNRHHKMDSADRQNRLDGMAQGLIGTDVPRPDGMAKATGTATYAAEERREGMLHGVLVRATVPGGRVADVDTDALAKALGDDVTVITDARLLQVPAQGTDGKAPPQGPDLVHYVGQPLALVVAPSFEVARHGARLLGIRYEGGEEGHFDPEDDATPTELRDKKTVDIGDLDAAMAKAAHSVDAVWRTPGHVSAAMEPHAAVAWWEGEHLTVRSALQMLKFNRDELADALGIPAENVRLLAPFVGGGFGSKLGISHEAVGAAIAARQLGRPVRVVLSRQQVFEAVMRRSETRQHLRLCADEEGRLTGIGHDCLVSNLPGQDFAEPVIQGSRFAYAAPNRHLSLRLARVNRTCAGSVRAPGEAVGLTALENAMDELAEAIGIDPVELRLRNVPEEDPTDGKPFSSMMMAEVLREGARRFDWQRRNPIPALRREGDPRREWLRGMGMSLLVRGNILDEAEARVRLLPAEDGAPVRAEVETDMTDIGTGSYAVLSQIAAEMLGLPMERVTTRLGDSALPPSPGSGGSWGAGSSGSSVYLACLELRTRLARALGCDEGELTLRDGQATGGNHSRPLAELLDGGTIEAVGHIEPGKTAKERRQATYGAQFAEVEVSRHTGEVRVRRMLGVFAAGRILNSRTARSQCLGGMTFGIGMALSEELEHDPRDGHLVNRDFAGYHIPVNADVPQLEVHLMEERDPWANPMQSKGIGELGICGAAAAITNAIHNATGARVRDYPATPDRVLAAMAVAN
ncbi:xanthine dehydrogenase [Brevirhabdus pacifica]|uniref:Xanthine dehydrogenase n=1 Tax=Brevirhabdus pacifica TaxID=1267768 RepID=A0A1U7DFU0_9RHOB|nr:xanthine dehydrogenase family protein molybdopterin-binding subunit [Brevirhabdus pacifica]APX88826.1 xanthine dehydrogenase [Brevirhabdus pacifica]OWU80069.1 xanthine dehydrogenase [Loktanella sp. 22II-4b]PJJ86639.1 xanthine dehydrogenase YagR molybdenum-binding subunit [Brevirhabdus pacifica]